ncbi:ABC transporter ATP-binding protein [Paenibacillus harenae]|uniref:ABC transporter ATP-binding protein n=1 Tax=Paenibacillus harenae TaxID=306543 RepID=UPI0027D795E4|nr:ABC transporter ATP-binding protein [Paenibacillus harenae]
MQHILYFTKKIHQYAGKILYLNLFAMMIISFLDGMAMLLLVPLLGISGILDLQTGTGSFLDRFRFLQDMPKSQSIIWILTAFIVLTVGQGLVNKNLSLRDIKIHTGFINHLRLEIYRSILQANWRFFIRKRKSDLINSLTDELGRVTNGTYLFLQFLGSAIFTLIQIGIAFWLSAKLTLFVLGCGLVIALFSRYFIKRAQMVGSRSAELARNYIGGITDHFNGIKDIKSNMLEHSRNEWLQDWSTRIARERYESSRLRLNSQLYFKLSSSLIIAAFIYFSSTLFQIQGGQLLLIILIFSRLWPRFTGLQSNLENIASSVPAFQSLTGLIDDCQSSKEVQGGFHEYSQVSPIRLEEALECVDVSYRYNPEGENYALRHVNMQIRANEMTAIVGRSGAGKSTLIDIVMGLLQPENGEVRIDGRRLSSDNLLSLRKSISYIPQDPFLFNGTIRENMLMMEPGASEDQLWEALGDAAASEFVRRQPQGLDTLIGDRGIRLSGGERQRLVLARTLLRKPSILVLDEATSALDTENEAKIQAVLEGLKGTMTIIVVAHRLSTIRNADQVVVLDQGRIVQKGKFTHLAEENGGMFAHLLGNQTLMTVN